MIVRRRSSLSGKLHEMDLPITQDQITNYVSGAFIQDAFPHLSADEREFIKTGITPKEWAEAFGEDE
jgi:hypothetical protein